MYLDSPDSLSLLLKKMTLTAEVYANGDFCGAWAVDTSGSKRIPFHIIGKGTAWLHFQDQPPRQLATGDLVMFPHDNTHVISNTEVLPADESVNAEMVDDGRPSTNMVCGFFEFKDKAALPLIDALAPVIVLQQSMNSRIKNLVSFMMAELQQSEPGYYTVVDQLAYLLFIQVLRHQIDSEVLNTGLLAALFDSKIGKAINSIHLKPEAKWTLESLAKECAMGRSSFSARFNKLVGMPAMQYVGYWRMQEARHLLRKTELSIPEISERCGYDCEVSFSKAFKKVTGNSPGVERRALKTEMDG